MTARWRVARRGTGPRVDDRGDTISKGVDRAGTRRRFPVPEKDQRNETVQMIAASRALPAPARVLRIRFLRSAAIVAAAMWGLRARAEPRLPDGVDVSCTDP